jgi:hypothetical protein
VCSASYEAAVNPAQPETWVAQLLDPIIKSAGEPNSAPISIVWREPPELSSILVSPSESLFSSRFVLCLVPPKSHAGMDLVPRFDRVEQLPCRIDDIHPCGLTWASLGMLPVGRWLALACARRCRRTNGTSLRIKAFLPNGLCQAIAWGCPLHANIWSAPYGYHSRSFL